MSMGNKIYRLFRRLCCFFAIHDGETARYESPNDDPFSLEMKCKYCDGRYKEAK